MHHFQKLTQKLQNQHNCLTLQKLQYNSYITICKRTKGSRERIIFLTKLRFVKFINMFSKMLQNCFLPPQKKKVTENVCLYGL